MALYAISDLHLSFGCDKPMDIFPGWHDYENRIKQNWLRVVKPDDTVVIPGDISWGLKLCDTVKDFEFLESLPGKKLLLKGNHDLWWSTAKKLREFLAQNEFKSISFVFNSAEPVEIFCVCGTRGWFYDLTGSNNKVLLREAGRLDTSLTAARATGLEPAVFLHYPPVYGEWVCTEILDVLKKHNIKRVYHGHIHGLGNKSAVPIYDGIEFRLLSCDCIDFCPVLIV